MLGFSTATSGASSGGGSGGGSASGSGGGCSATTATIHDLPDGLLGAVLGFLGRRRYAVTWAVRLRP